MHFEFFCFCPCKNTFPVSGPYEFPESSPVLAFSLKKKKERTIWKTSKCQPVNKNKTTDVLSLDKKTLYFEETYTTQNIITFSVTFVLLFASKVIIFCVTDVITFCVESYYTFRYYYILWQKLLHFASAITLWLNTLFCCYIQMTLGRNDIFCTDVQHTGREILLF